MGDNIILIKSKNFAVRIVKFYRFLYNDKKERILSAQILRSGTSIGANVRESRNAQSKKDFISKLNIALKEADETCYWLELLHESDTIDKKTYDSLYSDAEELYKILVSIIKSSKRNEEEL